MDNNLRNIERILRSFTKKCKDLKYTRELLFSFLMSGVISQAVEKKNSDDSIRTTKKQLVNSIEDMKKLFKDARKETNKLIKASNLELIQLMEQGDHVVKSPWSSWQYGVNNFYNDWHGTYKGYGGKTGNTKYIRNIIIVNGKIRIREKETKKKNIHLRVNLKEETGGKRMFHQIVKYIAD